MKTIRKVLLHLTKKISATTVLLVAAVNSFAQVSTNEFPPSFYENQLLRTPKPIVETLIAPNLEVLKEEDKVEDTIKSIPWRFGHAIDAGFTLKDHGSITKDTKGNVIWNLSIAAKNAISLNLNFDDFHLSENAKLFLYGESYDDVLGAITANNNKSDRLFSTRPIQGDIVHLELISPEQEFSKNVISIKQVVYGYRDLKEKAQKVFRSSAGCNININCEEGDDWQEVKKAVAMITTSSNTRICTGVLVNNVRQDSTPYLLTGAHCNTPGNAIFVFGYESEKCDPNTDGILTNTVSGATTKAVSPNNFTDFELLELSTKPPLSYDVFYAGWSAEDVPSEYSATIHHPVGDVKKISIDEDPSISSGYYNAAGSSHWTVANWEYGSTQGGSSGAPLFDQNQRVTGLLQGGDASCNNKAQDYYGKIAVSWNNRSPSNQQLKVWLDPDNTGTTILDGLSPNDADFDNDIKVVHISNVGRFFCDSSITPKVMVRNIGNDTVFSIDLFYNLDGGVNSTVKFQDTVLRNELVEIEIPKTTVSHGFHTLFTNAKIGGSIADQDSSNNIRSHSFKAATYTEELTIELKTDDFGEETTWSIIDASTGFKLYSEGPFASVNGGETFNRTICISDTSCFHLDLFDSASDGFNGSFGDGSFLIKDSNGDTLLFEDDFTNELKRNTICINDTFTSIEERVDEDFVNKIYPNPVKRGQAINIDYQIETSNLFIRLIDLAGREILTSSQSKLTIPKNLAAGMYLLQIESNARNGNIQIKKLIVE